MQNKRHLIQDIYIPQPRTGPPRISYSPSPSPPPPPPQLAPQTHRRSKPRSGLIFGTFSMIALSIGAGFFIKTSLASGSNEVIDSPKVKAATVAEQIAPIDFTGIEAQINAIISQYPNLQISVAYTDIKTATTVKAGVAEPYLAASTAKLLTAVLFLQEVQKGKYSLDKPVAGIAAKEQIRKMIEESDNASWEAFNKLLTGAALEGFAQATGLLSYVSGSNTGTPSDIALLLEKLYKNQLLNQSNTQLLLSYMQQASERQYIPAALPADTLVYHKAGYLEDRAHDAAIIDNGKRPFVLVIFTKSNGTYDFELGRKIMHDITAIIGPSYNL